MQPCSNLWNAEPSGSASTAHEHQPFLHHLWVPSTPFPPGAAPLALSLPHSLWRTLDHTTLLLVSPDICRHTPVSDLSKAGVWCRRENIPFTWHTYVLKWNRLVQGKKPHPYQCDIVESHDHNPILACDRDPAGAAAHDGGKIGPCEWPLPGSQVCCHLLQNPSTSLLRHGEHRSIKATCSAGRATAPLTTGHMSSLLQNQPHVPSHIYHPIISLAQGKTLSMSIIFPLL